MKSNKRKTHVKISKKTHLLHRKLPEDLTNSQKFISLPPQQQIPQQLEQQLRAFRSNRVHFANQIQSQLRNTSQLDPQIRQTYQSIAKLLKHFKSGRVPKAFTLIPNLQKWQQILQLTKPSQWSPQAVSESVKFFSSMMKPKQAQIFYNQVLLPACRTSISKHRKLNVHLYQALKKAFYKPAAWVKGILLPLCQQDCNLKQASIFGSVMSKVSIPNLHASAALMKLCQQEYTGPQSYFIKILLQKRFSLHPKVLLALTQHFLSFEHDERKMPVLWHQALLVFAQIYAPNLPLELKQQLKNLLFIQQHTEISPEIKKALNQSLNSFTSSSTEDKRRTKTEETFLDFHPPNFRFRQIKAIPSIERMMKNEPKVSPKQKVYFLVSSKAFKPPKLSSILD